MTEGAGGDHAPLPTTDDLVAALLFAAGDAAGALLRDYYRRDAFTVDTKGQDDVVTSADRDAEALIVRLIRARFPTHRIVAEEAGVYEGGEITWYVDPLDGTLNYANHLGSWSSCLAAVGTDGVIAAAVIDPLYDEAFRAAMGRGASCNGTPIAVRRLLPARAIVHAYVGGAGPWQRPAAAVFSAVAPQVRRMRIFGSLALALAYVAAGRLDGVVQLRASSWDYMAGAALVGAAGGMVTGPAGLPIDAESGGIVAAGTPELHALLLETVLSQPRGGS